MLHIPIKEDSQPSRTISVGELMKELAGLHPALDVYVKIGGVNHPVMALEREMHTGPEKGRLGSRMRRLDEVERVSNPVWLTLGERDHQI